MAAYQPLNNAFLNQFKASQNQGNQFLNNYNSSTNQNMGTKATAPVTTTPSNTIAPKYQQDTSPNTGLTLDQFNKNLTNYYAQNPSVSTGSKINDTGSNTAPLANTSNQSQNSSTEQTGAYNANPALISTLANQSLGQNLKLAQQAQDISNKAGQQISDIGQTGAKARAGYLTTGTSPVGEGNAAVLNQSIAAQQQAVAQGAQQALQGVGYGLNAQGQIQSALGTAAGLTQPQMQFGQLTNPQTGLPVSGGAYGSNPQLMTAVSQALQLVQAGADPNDPQVQALISTFGLPGQSLFTQGLQQISGGTYNPTALSTSAQNTAALGANAQIQAYNLNLGLQQLKTLQPVIQTFLSTAGINSTDSPLYNQPINSYLAKLGNPAAVAQYQYMINDLQKFASQMLAAGAGGTPTGVQAATDLMNPALLSVGQIQYALNTLDALGTDQVAILQQQARATGNTGYAGNPASTVSNVDVSPVGTALGAGITSPVGQFSAGLGLSAASWAKGVLSDLGGEILGFITRGLIK